MQDSDNDNDAPPAVLEMRRRVKSTQGSSSSYTNTPPFAPTVNASSVPSLTSSSQKFPQNGNNVSSSATTNNNNNFHRRLPSTPPMVVINGNSGCGEFRRSLSDDQAFLTGYDDDEDLFNQQLGRAGGGGPSSSSFSPVSRHHTLPQHQQQQPRGGTTTTLSSVPSARSLANHHSHYHNTNNNSNSNQLGSQHHHTDDEDAPSGMSFIPCLEPRISSFAVASSSFARESVFSADDADAPPFMSQHDGTVTTDTSGLVVLERNLSRVASGAGNKVSTSSSSPPPSTFPIILTTVEQQQQGGNGVGGSNVSTSAPYRGVASSSIVDPPPTTTTTGMRMTPAAMMAHAAAGGGELVLESSLEGGGDNNNDDGGNDRPSYFGEYGGGGGGYDDGGDGRDDDGQYEVIDFLSFEAPQDHLQPPAPPEDDYPLGCEVELVDAIQAKVAQSDYFWEPVMDVLFAVNRRKVHVVRHSGDYTLIRCPDTFLTQLTQADVNERQSKGWRFTTSPKGGALSAAPPHRRSVAATAVSPPLPGSTSFLPLGDSEDDTLEEGGNDDNNFSNSSAAAATHKYSRNITTAARRRPPTHTSGDDDDGGNSSGEDGAYTLVTLTLHRACLREPKVRMGRFDLLAAAQVGDASTNKDNTTNSNIINGVYVNGITSEEYGDNHHHHHLHNKRKKLRGGDDGDGSGSRPLGEAASLSSSSSSSLSTDDEEDSCAAIRDHHHHPALYNSTKLSLPLATAIIRTNNNNASASFIEFAGATSGEEAPTSTGIHHLVGGCGSSSRATSPLPIFDSLMPVSLEQQSGSTLDTDTLLRLVTNNSTNGGGPYDAAPPSENGSVSLSFNKNSPIHHDGGDPRNSSSVIPSIQILHPPPTPNSATPLPHTATTTTTPIVHPVASKSSRLCDKGNVACAAGRLSDAVGYFTRALACTVVDDSLRLLSNRSAAYLGLGDVKRSMSDARTVIKLAPSNYVGYIRAGNVLRRLHCHDVASRFYNQALRLDPTNKQVLEIVTSHKLHMQFAPKLGKNPHVTVTPLAHIAPPSWGASNNSDERGGMTAAPVHGGGVETSSHNHNNVQLPLPHTTALNRGVKCHPGKVFLKAKNNIPAGAILFSEEPRAIVPVFNTMEAAAAGKHLACARCMRSLINPAKIIEAVDEVAKKGAAGGKRRRSSGSSAMTTTATAARDAEEEEEMDPMAIAVRMTQALLPHALSSFAANNHHSSHSHNNKNSSRGSVVGITTTTGSSPATTPVSGTGSTSHTALSGVPAVATGRGGGRVGGGSSSNTLGNSSSLGDSGIRGGGVGGGRKSATFNKIGTTTTASSSSNLPPSSCSPSTTTTTATTVETCDGCDEHYCSIACKVKAAETHWIMCAGQGKIGRGLAAARAVIENYRGLLDACEVDLDQPPACSPTPATLCVAAADLTIKLIGSFLASGQRTKDAIDSFDYFPLASLHQQLPPHDESVFPSQHSSHHPPSSSIVSNLSCATTPTSFLMAPPLRLSSNTHATTTDQQTYPCRGNSDTHPNQQEASSATTELMWRVVDEALRPAFTLIQQVAPVDITDHLSWNFVIKLYQHVVATAVCRRCTPWSGLVAAVQTNLELAVTAHKYTPELVYGIIKAVRELEREVSTSLPGSNTFCLAFGDLCAASASINIVDDPRVIRANGGVAGGGGVVRSLDSTSTTIPLMTSSTATTPPPTTTNNSVIFGLPTTTMSYGILGVMHPSLIDNSIPSVDNMLHLMSIATVPIQRGDAIQTSFH